MRSEEICPIQDFGIGSFFVLYGITWHKKNGDCFFSKSFEYLLLLPYNLLAKPILCLLYPVQHFGVLCGTFLVQHFYNNIHRYFIWIQRKQKTLRVVTITMICSTLASSWKFQYFQEPIYNPVKHLWWSFYGKSSNVLTIFTKKSIIDARLGSK